MTELLFEQNTEEGHVLGMTQSQASISLKLQATTSILFPASFETHNDNPLEPGKDIEQRNICRSLFSRTTVIRRAA
jgi:hypothetical protein